RFGNITPDAHAALAYDGLRFLADAIQRAGTTEGKKLRDALAETKNFPGVTGIIGMDRDRNAVKPAVILKLEDGRYIYQETIQPAAAASPNTNIIAFVISLECADLSALWSSATCRRRQRDLRACYNTRRRVAENSGDR